MSHSKSDPPPANRSVPNLGLDMDDDAETRIFRPENSGVHSQIRDLPQGLPTKPLPLIDETKAFRPPPELIAAAKARKAAEKASKSVPPRARISAPPRPATKSAAPARGSASTPPRASSPPVASVSAHQSQRPLAASGAASGGPVHGIQDDATQVQQVPKELIYQARRARAERVREKVDSDQPKAVEESHIRRQARAEPDSVPSIPIPRPVEQTHSEVRAARLSVPPRSNPPTARRDSFTVPGVNAKKDGKFLWICAAFFMAYLVIVGAGVIL